MAAHEITLDQFQAQVLEAMAKGVDDFNPLFNILKQAIRQEMLLQVFREERAPDGTPWPKLKHRRGKILQDTGKLRGSITGVGRGAGQGFDRRTRLSMEVGTNIDYGKFHQYGTSSIPKREFLGVSDHLADRMAELAGDWLEAELGKIV